MGIQEFLTGYSPLIFGLIAFGITYTVIPVVINVSNLKHLFDAPSDERKVHLYATPNLGGVGIFAAALTVFAISGYAAESWGPFILAGLTILFFSGLKDDILVISPLKKLVLQCLAIAALVFGGDLVITNLGGMFGVHEVSYWAGAALTFYTMVVVVNAYNLIDGIDGLAGGVGVITSLFFGAWFWWSGMMAEAVLALVLTGALLAFLKYNFEPASIFMGDTGSQIVGYLLGFLAVSFVNSGVTSPEAVPFQHIVPVLVLSVLIVPLYDTLRVFIMRVANGRSPFQPDRLHVHHQLLDAGLSHKASCIVIYSFNVAIIGLTLVLSTSSLNINVLFATILLTAVVVFPTVKIKRRILKKAGVELPSVRRVHILERKYGISSHTGRRKRNGFRNGHSNGKREFEEVAV